jgi:hypothetical protein
MVRKRKRGKGRGWHKEHDRHVLAGKGIKTRPPRQRLRAADYLMRNPDAQHKVFGVIGNQELTARQVAGRVGLSEQVTREYLNRLVMEGNLYRYKYGERNWWYSRSSIPKHDFKGTRKRQEEPPRWRGVKQ